MIIHCVTIQHCTMQTKHHWTVEHCDQSFFFIYTHTYTHSPASVRVKELERLNRDFSLGSDCPNSTSTRTGFVGDQQRNYSHLQIRNSHTHLHTLNTKRSPFFSAARTDRGTHANTHTCAHREMKREND